MLNPLLQNETATKNSHKSIQNRTNQIIFQKPQLPGGLIHVACEINHQI